ncbi:hypothetical protein C6A85_90125, partial [Mycobacterium sp. ITM-2017-0098]
ARSMQFLAERLARMRSFRRLINRLLTARQVPIPKAKIHDYRQDLRLSSGAELADIVGASVRFTLPRGLGASDAQALFVAGAEEMPCARWSGAALARSLPNGTDRLAIGMRHDWPLRFPDLFARVVDAWFSNADLPPEIVDRTSQSVRPPVGVRDRRRGRSHR